MRRTCPRCQKAPSTQSGYCRPCAAQKAREWRVAHPKYGAAKMKEWRNDHATELKDYRKRWKNSLRQEVISHYSGGLSKCACCGEGQLIFLSLDHINGGGTKERRLLKTGGSGFYSRIRKLGFPPGFQVLCYNCNQVRGMYGRCPHQDGQWPTA